MGGYDVGLHLAPARRQLGDRRGVEVAEDRHRDRARDRGGRHHQHVGRRAGLAAERGSLLDAEPVLLVDHDQPEVGELHLLLEQRVGADDDARLAAGRLCECLPARRGVERPGQQRHPGGVVGTTEEAALRQVAEHAEDRAVVLLREHLGRRQQRRLPAGVDHLEHRPQRDDGLAGADLTLEQPVHRVSVTELLGDLLPHRALPGSELERQPLVEPVEQTAPHTRSRVGHGALDRRPAPGQHGLGDERLVVLQALLGRHLLGPGVGAVDPSQGLVGVEQVLGRSHVGGKDLGYVLDHLQGQADGGLEVPGVHRGGRRVDRDQLGHGVGGLVDVVHPRLGVGQLPLVAEPLQPADEQPDAAAGHRFRRAPGGGALLAVEVGEQQGLVALGAHPDLEPVRRPVRALVLVGERLRADHLAHQGQQVALGELVDLAQGPLAHVAAREQPEQVAHGLDAGLAQGLGVHLVPGLGAHHGRDRRAPAEVRHRHSTAISNG